MNKKFLTIKNQCRWMALTLLCLGVCISGEFTIPLSTRASPGNTDEFLVTTDNEACYLDSAGFSIGTFPLVGVFGFARGIAVEDCGPGTLWIASSASDAIVHAATDGSVIEHFALVTSIGSPTDLALDGSSIWICTEDAMVCEYSLGGVLLKSFATVSCGTPAGIAVDTAASTIWIAEQSGKLCEFSKTGSFLRQFSIAGSCPNPRGLDLDSDSGVFWVADGGQNVVYLINSTGQTVETISVVGAFGLTGVARIEACATGAENKFRCSNRLGQNYPNPFNPTTTVRYSIRKRGHVTLKIYSTAGELVRSLVNQVLDPVAEGYSATWDGRDDAGNAASTGVYFYRLATEEFVQTRKMVLIK